MRSNSRPRQCGTYLVCLTLLAALGCTGGEREANTASEQAATAIDAGDYSRAIAQLSSALARNPNDQKTRIQLASAYAARAGLPMLAFIGLGREMANAARDIDRLFEQRLSSIMGLVRNNMKNKAESQTLQVIEQIYMGSLRLATLLRQFEAVPVVATPMQFEDLNQAVFILSGDQTITSGGALFRAMLRVAAFRYRLIHDVDRIRIRDCRADLNALNQFVAVVYQESRLILFDMSMATLNSAKRHEYDVTIRRLDEGSQTLVLRLQQVSNTGLIDTSDIIKLFVGSCR